MITSDPLERASLETKIPAMAREIRKKKRSLSAKVVFLMVSFNGEFPL
jgi:acyl-CoA hydrolase